jgi:NitT/TauT family transport system ATP-binding protein
MLDSTVVGFASASGLSGCAETAFFNTFCGVLKPTASPNSSSVARHRLGLIQITRSFHGRNVLGNAGFRLEHKGLPRNERRAIALDYIESAGLLSFATKQINGLSGVELRDAIARAIAVQEESGCGPARAGRWEIAYG